MKPKVSQFLFSITTLLGIYLLLPSCNSVSNGKNDDSLFTRFVNPPPEARPFVRWWWNGNHITEKEIRRQLDVLQQAGIGGIEINPIEMPPEAVDIGTTALTWLSPEWNRLLALASEEAQERGMITDLIVGSGWPFGGEFLKEGEAIQRVIIHKIPCKEGDFIREDLESLYRKAKEALSRRMQEEAKSREVVFIRLVPENIQTVAEITDLTDTFRQNGKLSFTVPPGRYHLAYGILQRSNREVMHGAPGAAGPVMDHYRKEITLAYLGRLQKISEDTGIPLSRMIRALFCDSIELDGANWTDGMEELFFSEYGYRLEPWFPFVFYDPYTGYPQENNSQEFSDLIRRVRYDYNKLLVSTFLKNFTRAFQDFCTENGLLCRYQAYGTPFLMGMTEGNMIPDIPESNNWIYSADMNAEEWKWNQGHGYMIWNLYAASGGHLTGKKIISCEAMTNTRGVFKTSLDEVKRHDDMNFITGINHSVLHGYNYSPPEAGFPGWVRYGAYFSEQNPWWPFFSKWAAYNARLSAVFQNTSPVKNIAILGPEADIWSTKGLTRVPFHTEPWYCNRLWEPISQAGFSCDYISEKIIREGIIQNGTLNFGPMSYKTIFLCGVSSITPETALALRDFVTSGGKLVTVDRIPGRSLSLQNATENDSIIKNTMMEIASGFPNRFLQAEAPESEQHLLPWTIEILKKADIQPDVRIIHPDKNIFQIHKKHDDKEIWFFVNSNNAATIQVDAVFPTGKKTPWVWNPEDGTRYIHPYEKNPAHLTIELGPLESRLLVFEPGKKGKPENIPQPRPAEKLLGIQGPWKVQFEHTDGSRFERTFDFPDEFGTSADDQLSNFAGTVIYTTDFHSGGTGNFLLLDKVNKGVTEVFLNGKPAGINWYGQPAFRISGLLNNGNNHLEIRYTTVLSNYAKSLKDNATARKWTSGFENIPIGLEGEVTICN